MTVLSLIPTEAVTVIRPTVERDDLGEPVETGTSREAVRCVVCPGATSDMDATRPEGLTVAYTLHFPKTYSESLRGCSVEVRGETYDVVGDPQRTTEAATPGPFNLTVEVTHADV